MTEPYERHDLALPLLCRDFITDDWRDELPDAIEKSFIAAPIANSVMDRGLDAVSWLVAALATGYLAAGDDTEIDAALTEAAAANDATATDDPTGHEYRSGILHLIDGAEMHRRDAWSRGRIVAEPSEQSRPPVANWYLGYLASQGRSPPTPPEPFAEFLANLHARKRVNSVRANTGNALGAAKADAVSWTPPPGYHLPGAKPDATRKLKLLWAGDMKPRLFAGGTLVKGLLDQGAMSVVYAPSNVGKSFFCLDLALHIAMGWPWRGRKIKARGTVLYIAAEGGTGFVNRVAAMKLHYGIAEGEFFPLAVVASPIDLLDPKANLPELLELIQAAEQETGLPVVMVVIDTLSRAMAGGDENSPKDMTAFVGNADSIRHAEPSPHLMIVHHAGKDVAKGARGHSSLRAATDTEIELAKDAPDGSDKAATAVVKKQRDMSGEDVFPFTLRSVHLGEDEDGDAVTSAVVEHEHPAAAMLAATPERKHDASLRILRDALAMSGAEVIDPDNVPPDVRVVRISEWRDALTRAGAIGGKTADAKRKQFERIRTAAEKSGVVSTGGDFVWIG